MSVSAISTRVNGSSSFGSGLLFRFKYEHDGDGQGLSKPVLQIDEHGNTLAEFSSATNAAKALEIEPGSVKNICNEKQERTKSGLRFRWKFTSHKKHRERPSYFDDAEEDGGTSISQSHPDMTVVCDGPQCGCHVKFAKPVVRVDASGKVLEEYCSARVAGRRLGLNSGSVPLW